MRRTYLFAATHLTLLVVLGLSIYLYRGQLSELSKPLVETLLPHTPEATPGAVPGHAPERVILSNKDIDGYVRSIIDPGRTDIPRLRCPEPNLLRYGYLKQRMAEGPQIQYFFALDLQQVLDLLPRLIGSIIEVIRFLGPENCALSIIEGSSTDGTAEVLEALRSQLHTLGTKYYLRSSDIDPEQGDHVQKLAELRNMALQPLHDDSQLYSSDTTIAFLSDVAICAEDILELLYQRLILGADMTCAFDWTYLSKDPTFNDVWIARDMDGEPFFSIPRNGDWKSAGSLFWKNQQVRDRYDAHLPFQVFSCWNGAAVFTATPVMEKKIAFRAPHEGECVQGEPLLFCKDMWFHGYGKIAVIPSVNLEYSDRSVKKLKDLKGYTTQWIAQASYGSQSIPWQADPPKRVKCIPSFKKQYFEDWDQGLS